MNKGMLTVGIILLSLIALLLINVLNDYSTGGELDYYLVKETTDAAMEDAIDYVFLKTCGLYRIDKEKFVESFVYRFASSVDATRNYTISFYDINEVPPKVSVQVNSDTTLSFKAAQGAKYSETNKEAYKDSPMDITTSYDAILETNYISDLVVEEVLKNDNKNLKSYDQCRAYAETTK